MRSGLDSETPARRQRLRSKEMNYPGSEAVGFSMFAR
jgi:hypothetical protein